MRWRRKWQPTPVFLPGESQGRWSLVGCCLWHRTESNTTEATMQQQQQAEFQVALVVKNPPANAGDVRDVGSIPGSEKSPRGGNGNPLQDSCLENPMDIGAWQAAAAPAAAKLLQSCPTLCDPIDGSPPGSPVPGILQARTLEWVAISFSNA